MIQNFSWCSEEKIWQKKEWNMDGGSEIFLGSEYWEGSQGTGFTSSAEVTAEEMFMYVICILMDWQISPSPFVAHVTME